MEIAVATLMLTPFAVHQPDSLLKTLPAKSEKSGDESGGHIGGSYVDSVPSPLHQDAHSLVEHTLLPTVGVVNQSKSRANSKTFPPGLDNDRDRDKGKDRGVSGEGDSVSVVSSMTESVFASHKSGPAYTYTYRNMSTAPTQPVKSTEQSSAGLLGWSPSPLVAATDARAGARASAAAGALPSSSQDSASSKKSSVKGRDAGTSSRSLPSQNAQSNSSKGRVVTSQESSWDERSERSKVTFSTPVHTGVCNGSIGDGSNGSNGGNGGRGCDNGNGSDGGKGTTSLVSTSSPDIRQVSDHSDTSHPPCGSYTYFPPASPSQQLTQRRRSSSGDGPDSPRSPAPSSPRALLDPRPAAVYDISVGDVKRNDLKPTTTTSAIGLFDHHNQDQMSVASVVSGGTGRSRRMSAVLANLSDYYPQNTEIEGNLLSLQSTKSGDLFPSYHPYPSTGRPPARGGSVSSHSTHSSHASHASQSPNSKSSHTSSSSSSSHSSHSSRRQSSGNHKGHKGDDNRSPKDTIPTDPTDTIPTPLPIDQVWCDNCNNTTIPSHPTPSHPRNALLSQMLTYSLTNLHTYCTVSHPPLSIPTSVRC